MSNYYQLSRIEFTNWTDEAYNTAREVITYLSNCAMLDEDHADIVGDEYYSLNDASERWPWLRDTLIDLTADFDYSVAGNFLEEDRVWYYDDGISEPDITAYILSEIMRHYNLSVFSADAVIFDTGYDDKRCEGHHTELVIRAGHYTKVESVNCGSLRDMLQMQLHAVYVNGIESLATVYNNTIEQTIRTLMDVVDDYITWNFSNLNVIKDTFYLLVKLRNTTKSEMLSTAIARVLNKFNIEPSAL